ncbi:LysR family transcriptional regulator [Thalassobius vesicularis]|uniref:LysR family transcriptional regulator n=1 Tax=Thalassobius vesicularis TaxID=1294297 RepID=A0A4S3MCG0_9RHOB|nr:LysR family transcriptional regulator [Thalassobius vesicularis]THD75750.1 LysR family transcriptional regulator [Thalassobius vesicularis]
MVDSPGRITLWGVEVFVATAEEGSISAAARRLGASPSAISQQLTNLETAMGATLLHRNARPMALTPAGELFRRRASAILNEAAQARAELAMADMTALTRFRLGAIEDFEADVTPRLLIGLAERLKGSQFLLETGASHHLHDQLDARALDVIIAAEMGPPADWAEVHPILTEGFVAVLPKGRVDPGADLMAQLQTLPLVQVTTRHYMGRLLAAHLARQGLHLPHRFELDSYHAILALVAQGVGWSILPPLALMRGRRFAGALDVVQLPFAPLTRTIAVTARRDILQDMPEQLAAQLKPIVAEVILDPAVAAYPFMRDVLQLA